MFKVTYLSVSGLSTHSVGSSYCKDCTFGMKNCAHNKSYHGNHNPT